MFEKNDIHVHVPEGATPKDGPSAGVAMVTAIISVLTGIPVRKDVAMTGEITLRGRVLPIGGLKEKLLAALRGGIKTVLIPEENVKDLAEIRRRDQEQARDHSGRADGRRPQGRRSYRVAGADHLGRGGRSRRPSRTRTDRPARGSPPTDTIWCRQQPEAACQFCQQHTPRRKARGFCSRSVREASVFPRFFGQFRAISP